HGPARGRPRTPPKCRSAKQTGSHDEIGTNMDHRKSRRGSRLSIVLLENVLWTCVGSAETMREQCEHLLTVSEWSNVTLQIAPTGYYPGFNGPFNLATQSNGDELLYMPTATGGVTSNDRKDILHIVGAFSALQARALSADDSREFLRKAVVRWT
ncbi:DUF5753 domain-containing protein, partial [Actinomadura latina]|uniref:DUF5753 domain-containing protein n=1 Tax=Actinomadura latina TaxID=163603 RepID=UPI001FF9B593